LGWRCRRSSTGPRLRHTRGARCAAGGFGTLAPSLISAGRSAACHHPVVAFDRTGTRLGHGKGHYDRALAGLAARGLRPQIVGIAFAAQEVEVIPAEPHDVRLDWIVTERETLDMRPGN
jgi:5-formyltetrahydrofolate cyclo-ligase